MESRLGYLVAKVCGNAILVGIRESEVWPCCYSGFWGYVGLRS